MNGSVLLRESKGSNLAVITSHLAPILQENWIVVQVKALTNKLHLDRDVSKSVPAAIRLSKLGRGISTLTVASLLLI